jgi:hypothetical protein
VGVGGVFHFDPGCLPSISAVGAELPLPHDPFEIVFTGKTEELRSAAFGVIDVSHPALHLRHDALQADLAFDERELTEIAAVELEEIERAEEGPLTAEQQLVEVAPAIVIEATHFSIQNRGLAANGVGEFAASIGQCLKV